MAEKNKLEVKPDDQAPIAPESTKKAKEMTGRELYGYLGETGTGPTRLKRIAAILKDKPTLSA